MGIALSVYRPIHSEILQNVVWSIDKLMVANERRDSTLSVYIIIKQVSKMIIFTQLCKVQKYFVKKSPNFDLARSKCMSRKIPRDDLYKNTSQVNP